MPLLQSYLQSRPRYGIGASAVPWSVELPAYIRITDIDQYGRFRPDPAVSVADPMAINYSLVDGDLVVARTGASVGKSYRYRPVDGDLVFAGFLMAVRPDPNVLDPGYLSCIFQSNNYWNWIAAESMRSGQPGVNAQQLAQFEINPPCIEEQREIAEAIQRVDDLLDALERLIAKKRDVKQGMMQELITGRTRLPGSSAEWKSRTFDEVMEVLNTRRSQVGVSRYLEVGAYPVIDQGRQFIAGYVGPECLPIHPGAEGVCVFGDHTTISKYVDFDFVVGADGTKVFRPRSFRDCDTRYFCYLLEFCPVEPTGYNRHFGKLRERRFLMPSGEEQKAISKVLQAIDTEIEALERRLESARAVKVGMMQELLTGRTRLPVKEEASARSVRRSARRSAGWSSSSRTSSGTSMAGT